MVDDEMRTIPPKTGDYYPDGSAQLPVGQLTRRQRRDMTRRWKKKYSWIEKIDVGKEYIKVVHGKSELSEARQRQLMSYIQERRSVDLMFNKGMQIIDEMIMRSIKNSLKSQSKENKNEDESSDNS